MVDEAHSLGVLGETGHGIMEYFNMDHDVEMLSGAFPKPCPQQAASLQASTT